MKNIIIEKATLKDIDFIIEAIKEICKIDDKYADLHFRSQVRLLSDKNWKLLPNHIMKLENLWKDFDILAKKIWLPDNLKIPHLRKSWTEDYKKYYDEETKKMVEKRYKKDLELFNYSF